MVGWQLGSPDLRSHHIENTSVSKRGRRAGSGVSLHEGDTLKGMATRFKPGLVFAFIGAVSELFDCTSYNAAEITKPVEKKRLFALGEMVHKIAVWVISQFLGSLFSDRFGICCCFPILFNTPEIRYISINMKPNNPAFTVLKKSVILKDMSCDQFLMLHFNTFENIFFLQGTPFSLLTSSYPADFNTAVDYSF